MDRIRSIIFFLLCISPAVDFACGPYYPTNEAIRFHMVDPLVYDLPGFELFQFTMGGWPVWREEPEHILESNNMHNCYYQNINFWCARTNNNCDKKDIYAAVYFMDGEFYNNRSTNSFVHYLYAHNDTAALHYLQFADDAEQIGYVYDPWERLGYSPDNQCRIQYESALKHAANTDDKILRERYLYQAVKVAYSSDTTITKEKSFNELFEQSNYRGVEYYWALSRLLDPNRDTVKINYYAAKVFKHAPDRRYRAYENFHSKISIDRVLLLAKNKEERSAIYAMYAFNNPGRNLSLIQKAYWDDPASDEIPFLLMREMSKLEYSIYTPYFQNYETYFHQWRRWDGTNETVPVMQRKSASDRRYAADIAVFMHYVSCNNHWDRDAWRMMRSYFMIMSEDYVNAENELTAAQRFVTENSEKWHTLEMLRSFCAISAHPESVDQILASYRDELIDQDKKENASYLFGMARSLEYAGETTKAALLMSKLNPYHDMGDVHEETFWRTAKLNQTLLLDFYEDYFFYLDAEYTNEQMVALIDDVAASHDKTTLNKWLYKQTKRDLPRLYDLLGTKYIRSNQLQSALNAFKQVNDTLYTSINYPFATYLDANPFGATMYSGHGKSKYDTIRYDKEEITRQLIKYLNLASDTTRKNRDYYYFLVANCYYNMTQYGNSWMMRRYFWTTKETPDGLPDQQEYFTCKLAIQYYLKARSVSRNKKFSALCLRMAGKCEGRSINWQLNNGGYHGVQSNYDDRDQAFKLNKYYSQLQTKYPEYYSELIRDGNCNSFEQYFVSARK